MSQRLDVICNDQERSGKNNNSTNCEDLSVPVDRFRNIVNYNWGEAIRATHCLNETMQNKTLQAGMIF